MTDAIELLRNDHDEIKKMLDELAKGPVARSGASDDQLALRKRMVEQLVIENSKHEVVEEEYFWPAVREHVPGGDQIADRAIDQEQKAKVVLFKLSKLGPRDAEFENLLSEFTESAREHISYEEDEAWPPLTRAISGEQLRELGGKLEQAKQVAPTKPHPNVPPQPGILKATAPAAAAADKARDAAAGRDS